MLVDFTEEELQELNEIAQKSHLFARTAPTEKHRASSALVANALDALARYREAERAAAEPEPAAEGQQLRYGALR